MFNYFLVSLTVVSYVLGVSLPEAIEEDVYPVATIVTEDTEIPSAEPPVDTHFEWQVMKNIRSDALAPWRTDNVVSPDSVNARGALVMDVSTRRVLWQKNPNVEMPIASITKLMTALVWLDHEPPEGLEHVHTFAPEDNTPDGKELNLPEGEKLKAFDLLRSSIVGSDNDTILALAHTTGYSDQVFVGLMNEKARMLGMKHSVFADQTGLSADNISTPYDIARLAAEAFSKPEIQEPAVMAEHFQETVDTHVKTRVATTNQLLFDRDLVITGGKTGFTTEAGYCLVVKARVPNSDREVIAVVLGSSTDSGRFDEAKKLLLWTFAHHAWPE